MSVQVIVGDCREVLAQMAPESVDAIVTDPPYELGFMGKRWDAAGVSFDPETWRAAHRVLKPGGHLLAFGGTRTFHRIGVAIEDGGFEIKDCLSWLHGQGFPKHKTHLKPGWEPIVLAAKRGERWLNVDGCRVEIGDVDPTVRFSVPGSGLGTSDRVYEGGYRGDYAGAAVPHPASVRHDARGRWPANVCLDEDAAALLDEMSGERGSNWRQSKRPNGSNEHGYGYSPHPAHGVHDTGGASRFFYVAKASRRERNAGLEGMPEYRDVANVSVRTRMCNVCGTKAKAPGPGGRYPNCDHENWSYVDQQEDRHKGAVANHHPTVKPVSLMRWLARLVTPPGGIVLDPFMGSGTTGIAAVTEGFRFIGVEQSEEYAEIARKRIAYAQGPLLARVAAR